MRTQGQVCAGRDAWATCVALTPLFALSGVAEMPDNEVLGYTKRFLVLERGRAALKPVGHRPPPCNLCAVAGWSGCQAEPGLARLFRSPPQLAGSITGAVALTRGLPLRAFLLPACSGRMKGRRPSSSRDLLTQLIVPMAVEGKYHWPSISPSSPPPQLHVPNLGHLGLLPHNVSRPHG